MLKDLEILCALRGVSGNEEEVRDFIISRIKGCCDFKVDGMGSIIAFKKGKKSTPQRLMISAHMDEVGFVVTNITEKGYLKFAVVGGIDPRVVFGRRVIIGAKKVPGVIASAPVHQISPEERGKAPSMDCLYIDIGAQARVDAEKFISVGDTAVFDAGFSSFGDGLVKGRALDDRAGCAVLLDMITGEIPYDMFFTFVVQEEIGLRGAKCAAFSVEPDFAIVVEATTAADIAGIAKEKQVCSIGGGAALSFMDGRTVYDKKLYQLAFALADTMDIKVQPKLAVAGGNDAGAIHTSRGGVRTISVSVPCRYLHSPVGVIAKSDFMAVREITGAIAERITAGEI